MNSEKLISDFNHTIDHWINQLEQYNLSQLRTKPSDVSWSLGQVYRHLINNAHYYVEQIKICVSSNENETREASAEGKAMLLNNAFPNILIEGPDTNVFIPQPENKEELRNSLVNLKNEINELFIIESPFKGKTKHPGLKYFSAIEWLQFTEMHFRHHLKQKKRIDDFLNNNL